MQQFQNFDFSNNEKWVEYSKSIDSTISEKRLDYIKRRWYKTNIDRNFNPDFDKPTFDEFKKQQEDKDKQSYQSSSFLRRCLYDSENGMKLMFMTASVFMHTFAQLVGCLFCILALIRQLKAPKSFKEVIQKLLINEFSHNLLYLLILGYYRDCQNFLTFSPVMIHSWVGICDYAYMRQGKIYETLKHTVDKVRRNKNKLMKQKNFIEIALFPLMIVMIFFGRGSFVLFVLYGNFLRFKYMLNDRTKEAWSDINATIEQYLVNKPFLMRIYSRIQSFGGYLIKFKGKK